MLIGDPTDRTGPAIRYDEAFILVDEKSGAPLRDKLYRIEREDGSLVSGRTDAEGRTALILSDHAEKLSIEVLS